MTADQLKARVKALREQALKMPDFPIEPVVCPSFESYVQVSFRDPVDSYMGPIATVFGLRLKPSADLRGDEVELRWVLQ